MQFGNIPPVVKNLLIINILLFLATYIAGQFFMVDLTRALALYYFESEYFQPFQYVTHMFMHGGLTHLFFNMFALWMFGRVLETVWGSKRFFIYYMVTGLGAAALHTFVNWIEFSQIQAAAQEFAQNPTLDAFKVFINKHFPQFSNFAYDNLIVNWEKAPQSYNGGAAQDMIRQMVQAKASIPTVGASGAVFGVLLAFGMMFPNTQLMLIFPPIPIRAKYFVIGYGLLELYLGMSNSPADNVAHFAHLGGMLFGIVMILYWKKNHTLYK